MKIVMFATLSGGNTFKVADFRAEISARKMRDTLSTLACVWF